LASNEANANGSEARSQPNQRKKQRSDSIEATQFASTPNHEPDA